MAEGLAAAHAQGLIHRDVKPANVWLETPSGQSEESGHRGHVKLLDFGLARAEDDKTHLTSSGVIVGTPAFMAPEQARSENVDGRADLFSLGCVLYVMLTGKRPFVGETTMGLLSALALDTPEEPHKVNPAVSPAVSALTMRLLAKKPGGRVATARAAAEELRRLANAKTETILVQPAPPADFGQAEKSVQVGGGGRRVACSDAACSDAAGGDRDHYPRQDGQGSGNRAGAGGVHGPSAPEDQSPGGRGGADVSRCIRPTARAYRRRARWNITYRNILSPYWGIPSVVSPDGSFVAISDPHGPVTVRKVQSGELYRVLGGSEWAVRGLAWSPNGKMLVACGDGPTALIWDVEKSERLPLPPLPNRAFKVAWSPDGEYLAIACDDNAVHVWERTTNEMLPPLKDAYERTDLGVALGWSSDGKWIACAGSFTRWSLHTVLPPRRHIHLEATGQPDSLAWSPNGKRVAVGYHTGTTIPDGIGIFDADTGKLLQKIEQQKGFLQWPFVRWLGDEKILTHLDKKLAIVEAASGKILGQTRDGLEVQPFPSEDGSFFPAVETKYDRLSFYTLDPENPFDKDKQLLREKKLFTPKFQKENAQHVAWSPDGKTLATGEPAARRKEC